MKKTLILPVLLSLLTVSTLTGCGDNQQSSSNQPAVGGVTHDHKYDGYEIDGDVHYQKCTYLNCKYETAHTNHVYDQDVYTPAAFKSEATCESAALFFRSCVCGVISTTETFEHGTPLNHTSFGAFKSDATNHWKECDCGETHGVEAHDLVAKDDVATCTTDGGKYNECRECGWTTPIAERENYVAALGHQFDSTSTVSSFPSNSSEGSLSLNCTREGCGAVRVALPLATEDNYTFAKNGNKLTATLKEEALAALVSKYSDIKELATILTGKVFETSAASVGYPYEFRINGKQVLPSVPSDVNYDENYISVVIALKTGDKLRIYNNGNLVSFEATNWGPLYSGTTYTATNSSVLKLHLSKDGAIYSEVISTLPYDNYTIKVDGKEVADAQVPATGSDFAKFEVELEKDQVVTFYGDGNALSGGDVATVSGYTAFSAGYHTFYINNQNNIYVVAPELEQPVEVTYYYYNHLGWETVNCYSWYTTGSSTGNLADGWPGTAMTPVEEKEGWYTLTVDLSVPASSVNVIFNNGTTQTADIEVFTDIENVAEAYYYFGLDTTVYDSFEATEAAAANAPEAPAPSEDQVWGVVGSGFTSSDWNADVWMSETETEGVWEATITSTKAIEFKIRKEGKWDVNYGGSLSNGTVSGAQNGANIQLPAGTYKITFDETTHLITVTPITE